MAERSTVDHYEVLRLLGRGASAKVRLVRDTNTGSEYAMKILKHEGAGAMAARFVEMTKSEVNVLKQINHPNIVNLIATVDNTTYNRKQGKGTYPIMYIVMELCPNGELFEVLFQTGRFEEKLARTFFQQIISGLEAIHNAGQSHRDMKPENLLFDSEFNLKIADFGFAVVLSGRDGSGMLHTHLGTESYMAPEIHTRTPYRGADVDLFATAIILFIMMGQNPPFGQANPNDPYYKLLYSGQDRFWQLHGRNKPQGFFSTEFQDLLKRMLALAPADRLTIPEIKAHAWYNQDAVTKEELVGEIAGRRGKIAEAAQRAAQAKLARVGAENQGRFGGTVHQAGRAFRSELEETKTEITRTLQDYEGDMSKFTEFLSTSTADELWSAFLEYFGSLEDVEVDIEPSAETYRFKANVKKDLGGVDLTVKITSVSEALRGVTFSKNAGNTLDFIQLFNDVNEKLPDLADGIPA